MAFGSKHSEFRASSFGKFPIQGKNIAPDWTVDSIVDTQVNNIREKVGDARVICGLSGGVDSSVAAALYIKL